MINKKFFIFILIFILNILPCNALPEEITAKEENGLKEYCFKRVCIVENNHKYGLKTNEFEQRIKEYLPIEYDYIMPIDKYSLWLLKKNNKYGLYYKEFNNYSKGKFLLKCKYDEITKVGSVGYKVKKANKYAFFGYYDELLYGTYLTNFRYDNITTGKKGLSVEKNGKWFDKNPITLKNRIHYAGTLIISAPLGWLIFRGM